MAEHVTDCTVEGKANETKGGLLYIRVRYKSGEGQYGNYIQMSKSTR